MARQPNLWHSDQICDIAAKLWQGRHICGRMAKSVSQRPYICGTAAISVAQRPYLWHSSQICSIMENFYGIAAKSVAPATKFLAQQPNLFTKSCTKEENIRIYFPVLFLRRQSKNWIVITKMYKLCTLKCVLHTVKPLITNTSEEFIKCRLDNFSMSFILYYVNFSICENK